MSKICTIEDEYIKNRLEGAARWVCTLSDGTVVYEDDNRPDVEPWNSWARLRAHCLANQLHITDMYLQFRSHTERLPNNADGYYFVRSALGQFASNAPTQHFMVVGTIKGNKIFVEKYKIPELIVVDSEFRELKDNDPCLISKI